MFYILFVLFISDSVNGIGQPHYECGENGRFEYCIDGVPGCIVGCHCHPGFYFDTETKICEPNAKLVQEYRRMFSKGFPTRVPDLLLPLNTDLEPTPTTISPIDTHVENIAKDSDDLGDWLYNQFFKTIETQIINNTDTDSASDKPPTRRAGGGRDKKKLKNRKFTSKKGKKKKDDLRRKLLRITEDDSMFDSSSGSSEASSNSGSSSDDSSSDTSSDNEGGGGGGAGGGVNNNKNNGHKHDDKEHGHRKILYINKKPKPPLPSFIFLPNLETAFFPPIGLPGPAIPMYPMVPVPPMPPGPPGPPPPGPPGPFPPPGPPSSKLPLVPSAPPGPPTTALPHSTPRVISPPKPKPEEKGEKEEKNESKEKNENKEKSEKKDKVENNEKSDKILDDRRRAKGIKEEGKKEKNKGKEKGENETNGSLEDLFLRANKHGPIRKKLRQRLRQIISTARKKTNYFPPETLSEFENPDFPEIPAGYRSSYIDDTYSPDVFKPTLASAENVDFKYLSQLIHKNKNKLNKQNQIPVDIGFPTRKSGGNFGEHFHQPLPPTTAGQPVHRAPAEYRPLNNHRQLETNDEAYYSNLGHQIASLIRKIDDAGEQKVNIEIERRKASPPSAPHILSPFMLGNSYAPRSYWERSVRSLLKRFASYSDELYPQKTYEDSLFNLERRVETVASTTRPLSLDDIENVVFWIDKTKSTLASTTETPVTTTISSDMSLNVNLLPHTYEQPTNVLPNNEYGLRGSPQYLYNNTELLERFINAKNLQNSWYEVPYHSYNNLTKYYDLKNMSMHINGNYLIRELPFSKKYNKFDLGNSLKSKLKPMYTQNNSLVESKIENLQRMVGAKLNEVVYSRKQLPNVPWLAPKLADVLSHREIYRMPDSNHYLIQPFQNYQRKSNHQTSRHYDDNNNNNRKGIPVPRISNVAVRRKPKPSSYFHQEYQHLDVFN